MEEENIELNYTFIDLNKENKSRIISDIIFSYDISRKFYMNRFGKDEKKIIEKIKQIIKNDNNEIVLNTYFILKRIDDNIYKFKCNFNIKPIINEKIKAERDSFYYKFPDIKMTNLNEYLTDSLKTQITHYYISRIMKSLLPHDSYTITDDITQKIKKCFVEIYDDKNEIYIILMKSTIYKEIINFIAEIQYAKYYLINDPKNVIISENINNEKTVFKYSIKLLKNDIYDRITKATLNGEVI